MSVDQLNFLTIISRNHLYRTAESLQSSIGNIIHSYNAAEFHVSHIHADNKIGPLFSSMVKHHNCQRHFAITQAHAPEAERNNPVVKERIRTVIHRLPFKSLPKIMIKFLVMESAKGLNYFTLKGGISRFYSPRIILHQETLE
jgi:hypothetical protein